jgi:hypothetical protein
MKKTIMLGTLALTLTGMANLYSAETTEQGTFDLSKNGYTKWKSVTPEASITTSKDGETPTIIFKVKVDHSNGKGWDRIYKYFFRPPIDISKYKEYVFEYKVSTSRADDNKDKTPIYAFFQSDKTKVTYALDAGKEDSEWHTKVIPIADIIKRSGKSAADWQKIQMLQFGVTEAKYPDKTELTIEIKNVRFQ